jgi:hypothetical protein
MSDTTTPTSEATTDPCPERDGDGYCNCKRENHATIKPDRPEWRQYKLRDSN